MQQIEGPENFRKDVLDKTAEKLEFMAQHQGPYKFCFRTRSLFTETVDFDVHIGHIPYYDQKVQDGNVNFYCIFGTTEKYRNAYLGLLIKE